MKISCHSAMNDHRQLARPASFGASSKPILSMEVSLNTMRTCQTRENSLCTPNMGPYLERDLTYVPAFCMWFMVVIYWVVKYCQLPNYLDLHNGQYNGPCTASSLYFQILGHYFGLFWSSSRSTLDRTHFR